MKVINYITKTNDICKTYKIVKYNKDLLASDLVTTYGLLRSVIVNPENRVVSFAPPKSISAETFMNMYPQKTPNIVAEDFVEGTMINVFFDEYWRISTRSTIDANMSFYKTYNGSTESTTMSFNEMFNEACLANNFYLEALNQEFCYSFVLQHPNNRIVVPVKHPQLYLA